ncbi:MAG: triose-phosphate isomerase [Chitinophagaceae bacterium]|nr:MAG: triose-phosphate isomerase [Chitinophagaceae bacterium]
MRKKIAAANWKMNLTLEQGEKLIQGILDADVKLEDDREVVVCTPFPYLMAAKEMLKDHAHFFTGAQNCASEKSGAYTGEVSAEMLQSVQTDFVIIGHSERRQYFNETNELLLKKTLLAMEYGLKVIFCCGEPLEIRKENKHEEYVQKQLVETVATLSADQIENIVIAYEPIWAIGTGHTATPQQAQEVHAFIRSHIAKRFGNDVASQMTILYGGSCKPDNAAELFACEDVDGALVGGASLKVNDFTAIIRELVNSKS